MNFKELKQKSLPHFYALKIDGLLSQKKRKTLRMTLAVLALLSFSFSFDSLPLHFGSADGFFFLFLIAFLVLFLLELFYRSMIGQGFSPLSPLEYTLSELIFSTDEIDASRALFESRVGLSILARLGVPKQISQGFIYENRVPVVASSFEFVADHVSLVDYVSLLYESDKFLQNFLSKNSINKEMLISATKETSKSIARRINRERFWTKENLGAIPSLATNSFFETVTIHKTNPFLTKVSFSELDIHSIKADEEVLRLEYLLSIGANIAVISEDKERVEEKVRALHKKMALGVVSPEIEHKKIFSFNTQAFLNTLNTAEYQAELSRIFSSKNLIERVIYINDFTNLLLRFREVKIDPNRALFHHDIKLIVWINEADYKFFVETSKTLSQKFSIINL